MSLTFNFYSLGQVQQWDLCLVSIGLSGSYSQRQVERFRLPWRSQAEASLGCWVMLKQTDYWLKSLDFDLRICS